MGRTEASRGEAGGAQRPLPKARRPLPPCLAAPLETEQKLDGHP